MKTVLSLLFLTLLLSPTIFTSCASADKGAKKAVQIQNVPDSPNHMWIGLEGQKLMVEFTFEASEFLAEKWSPSDPLYGEALKSLEKKFLKTDDVLMFPPRAHCTLSAQSSEAKAPQNGKSAKVECSYNFTCLAPNALNRVQVMLFQKFPRFKTMKAETVIKNQESAQFLTTDNPSIRGFVHH